MKITRCRPNGTNHDWCVTQCYRGAIIRLQAARRHRLAWAGEAACRLAVDCYRRRRQMPESKTILALTLCVGGPVISTKMGFFNKIDNIVIVKAFKQLLNTTNTMKQHTRLEPLMHRQMPIRHNLDKWARKLDMQNASSCQVPAKPHITLSPIYCILF